MGYSVATSKLVPIAPDPTCAAASPASAPEGYEIAGCASNKKRLNKGINFYRAQFAYFYVIKLKAKK